MIKRIIMVGRLANKGKTLYPPMVEKQLRVTGVAPFCNGYYHCVC